MLDMHISNNMRDSHKPINPWSATVYITLPHYVITRFLRFSEGFFAICSSYFISGFGAGNLKIS